MIDGLRAQSYLPLLTLHGLWRWAVLAAAVVAVSVALYGLLSGPTSQPVRSRTNKVFVLAVDIQLLLGLALFVFASPIARAAFQSGAPGEAIYFGVVHFIAMLGVVILAHAGKVFAARAHDADTAHRRAALFFSPALLILLVATPWWRPLARL